MKTKHSILFGLGVSTLLAMALGSCSLQGGTSSEEKPTSSGSSSAHVHSFGDYQSDENNHWRECSCGEKKVEAHTFGDHKDVIKKATEKEAGTKGYRCAYCRYVKDEVSYTTGVSDEDWDGAFKFEGDFTLTYKADVYYKSSGVTLIEDDDIYVKNGDIVYSKRKGDGNTREYYYTKSGQDSDAKYYVYSRTTSKDSEDESYWTKGEDASKKIDQFNPFDLNAYFFNSRLSVANTYRDYDEVDCGYNVNPKGDTIESWSIFFEDGKVTKMVRRSFDKDAYNNVTTYTYTYEISAGAEALTLPHGHTLNDSYTSDATSHWYSCSECDEKVEKSDHAFRNILDLNSSNEVTKVCSVCGYSADVEDSSGVSVDSVLYGQYPQSYVSDSSLLASLDALTSPEKNGWYLLDGSYYAKKTAEPNSSTYTFDDGTKISSGTSYWFKVEPIEWTVISSDGNQYSLVSRMLLDTHIYNEYYNDKKNGYYANNYEKSEIRKWLTGDFRSLAFPITPKLKQVYVDNSAKTTWWQTNEYASGGTNDYVYLLSAQDYKNAKFSLGSKVTDYAIASGARIESTQNAHYRNGYYWTRSPDANNSYSAHKVDPYGYIAYTSAVNYEGYCVRPGITVKAA